MNFGITVMVIDVVTGEANTVTAPFAVNAPTASEPPPGDM